MAAGLGGGETGQARGGRWRAPRAALLPAAMVVRLLPSPFSTPVCDSIRGAVWRRKQGAGVAPRSTREDLSPVADQRRQEAGRSWAEGLRADYNGTRGHTT
jgi:hypothetical protein